MIERINVFKRLSTLTCYGCSEPINRVYYQGEEGFSWCPSCADSK